MKIYWEFRVCTLNVGWIAGLENIEKEGALLKKLQLRKPGGSPHRNSPLPITHQSEYGRSKTPHEDGFRFNKLPQILYLLDNYVFYLKFQSKWNCYE